MTQATNASTFNFSELDSLQDMLNFVFANEYMEVTGDTSPRIIGNIYGGIYLGKLGEAADAFTEACVKALNENVDIAHFIQLAQEPDEY